MTKREKFWKQQIEILKEEAELEDLEGEDICIETEKEREKLCGGGFDYRRYGGSQEGPGENTIGYSQIKGPEIIIN